MGLQQAHSEVAGMIHAGTPFHAIEEQIGGIPGLLDDERSALWLYAWSLADRPARPERDVRACAALFAGSD